MLNLCPWFRRWAEKRWQRTRWRAWIASQLYAGKSVHRVRLSKNGKIVHVK